MQKAATPEKHQARDTEARPQQAPEPVVPTLPPPVDPALHVAAKAGDAMRVTQLLEQGLDPGAAPIIIHLDKILENTLHCVHLGRKQTMAKSAGERDHLGCAPYAVAADKTVRDAFRRFMAAEPGRWNYAGADIPSALTPDMEAHQAAREVSSTAAVHDSCVARMFGRDFMC